MFLKRNADQSESKIGSDKIPAKKDQARFAGPLRWAFGLNALLNTVDFIVLLTELTYERAFCRLYNGKYR